MPNSQHQSQVSLFIAGPPKCATTWLYYCLREHPDVQTARTDEIMYFDMFHARGLDWYMDHYPPEARSAGHEKLLADTTSSYIWSARSAERIHSYNPDARIMVVLRNPVERAFSHYWHLKNRGLINYEFADILTNYQTFSCWLEPGFVNAGIKRYLNFFPREQMHFALFEDLRSKPVQSIKSVFQFAGIDADFLPPSTTREVNVAGPRKTLVNRVFSKAMRTAFGEERMNIRPGDTGMFAKVSGVLTGKSEYQQGMDDSIRRQLQELAAPEIEEMEELTGFNLSHWS